MKIIGAILCAFLGHKRGKFAYQGTVHEGHRLKTYRCPRCDSEWRRRVKAEINNGTPTDGSPRFQETSA